MHIATIMYVDKLLLFVFVVSAIFYEAFVLKALKCFDS